MLTRARMDNDLKVIKIINQEIDRRFESERDRHQKYRIEIHYSDLLRCGYSASQESVSRFLHRQRLTHEAGVALAKIHLAMKEGGAKCGTGKRTRWFYERARGQCMDAKARESTPAKKKTIRCLITQQAKIY